MIWVVYGFLPVLINTHKVRNFASVRIRVKDLILLKEPRWLLLNHFWPLYEGNSTFLGQLGAVDKISFSLKLNSQTKSNLSNWYNNHVVNKWIYQDMSMQKRHGTGSEYYSMHNCKCVKLKRYINKQTNKRKKNQIWGKDIT